MQLYVIPFFAIGRRLTIDIEFRFRGSFDGDRDLHVLHYDSADDGQVCYEIVSRSLPELVSLWAGSLGDALIRARSDGYSLAESDVDYDDIIGKLQDIRTFVTDGYWDRAGAVTDFLSVISELASRDTYYLRGS